jgi:hypothetical protein
LSKKKKQNPSNHSHAYKKKKERNRKEKKISSFSTEFVKRFRTPTGLAKCINTLTAGKLTCPHQDTDQVLTGYASPARCN